MPLHHIVSRNLAVVDRERVQLRVYVNNQIDIIETNPKYTGNYLNSTQLHLSMFLMPQMATWNFISLHRSVCRQGTLKIAVQQQKYLLDNLLPTLFIEIMKTVLCW
ncbi:Hypothetical_protein [Hexamita inflata]|uniref:Hypothetical_protein n=1 Tax=Hexamita inflata TaxID=28002 RepID=A0AA86NJ21_9EUKA|nr:Hypothetical protein HINF_LOCUS8592 [Hexamita inflata]